MRKFSTDELCGNVENGCFAATTTEEAVAAAEGMTGLAAIVAVAGAEEAAPASIAVTIPARSKDDSPDEGKANFIPTPVPNAEEGVPACGWCSTSLSSLSTDATEGM
jgi:hypothetical protein